MRIRSIKPEFFKHEDMAELEPYARLLFIGLWCLADANGVIEDRPKRIAIEVFPYNFTDVSPLLHQLHEADFIIRYSVAGKDYIQVPSFREHQRLSGKEAQSTGLYPIPTGEAVVKQRGSSDTFTIPSGTGNREQGKDIKGAVFPIASKPRKEKSRFIPPSLEELTAFCRENRLIFKPRAMLDYYTSNGWKVGKNPMKDWKAAARGWNNRELEKNNMPEAPVDPRPTKFKVQPIIDPGTGEELEPVRTLEYPTFDAMQAAMKAMQVDRKDDNAGYWLFTKAGYAQQLEAARKKRGLFTGLVRKI